MSSEDISPEQPRATEISRASPSLVVPSISVSILSPSSELPHQLSFPCVPTTSTVGELKQRIRDSVPSRPDLERLRLIHRGRMLSRDTDTMSDVFGPAAADDSSAKSLHLVLRPLATDSTNPSLPPSSSGRQSPSSALLGSTSPHEQIERRALAESLDHHLQEHNRATQRNAHAVRHGQINPLGSSLPARHMVLPGEPGGAANSQTTSTFARYIANHQQMRTAAGMTGFHPNATPSAGSPSEPSGHDIPQEHRVVPEDPPNGQNQSLPGLGGGFTRTYATPNGHRWHTTVNYSSVTIPNFNNAAAGIPPTPHNVGASPGTMPAMPGIPGFPDLNAFLAAATAGPTGGIPIQHGFPGIPAHTSATVQVPARNQLLQGHSELDLNLAQVNQLRDQIHALRQRINNRLGDFSDERFRVSNPRLTATQRNTSPENSDQRSTLPISTVSNTNTYSNLGGQPSALRTESQALGTNPSPVVPIESQRSPDPVVYLLSSPSGPQALIVSPSGLYNTGVPHTHRIYRAEHIHYGQRSTEPRQREAPHAAHQNGQHHPNRQAQGAANGAPFAGLLQGLAPLGANIWLIARLIGFVVLFTGNSSWQRTVMLVFGAIIVFLLQTGILGPVTESIWGPIRRHIEGVLLSPGRRRIPDTTGNAQNASARGNEVENMRLQGHQHQPDPRNTAARLVHEHQRGQRAWVYETIRAIERAIIIFVASLVPGLGERHIAELDAAQQVERVENERRAEAEAQEPIGAHIGLDGAGTDNTNQRRTGGTSGAETGPERDPGDRDEPAELHQGGT